jgi:hypothetical protein
VVQYDNYQFWTGLGDLNAGKQPCTTHDLRDLGRRMGLDVGVAPVTFNMEVGMAFQDAALRFFGIDENRLTFPAPQRHFWNGYDPNKPSRVRPDGLDPCMIVRYGQYGSQILGLAPRTMVVEVKAVNGLLDVASNDNQLLGELEFARSQVDYLSTQPFYQSLNPPFNINTLVYGPVLFLITTDNTILGSSIALEAAAQKVNVWHSKAKIDPATGEITFTQPQFVYSRDPSYSAGSYVPINFLRAMLMGATLPRPVYFHQWGPNNALDPDIVE